MKLPIVRSRSSRKGFWDTFPKCCKAQDPSPISEFYAASDEIWNRRMENLREWKVTQCKIAETETPTTTATSTPVAPSLDEPRDRLVCAAVERLDISKQSDDVTETVSEVHVVNLKGEGEEEVCEERMTDIALTPAIVSNNAEEEEPSLSHTVTTEESKIPCIRGLSCQNDDDEDLTIPNECSTLASRIQQFEERVLKKRDPYIVRNFGTSKKKGSSNNHAVSAILANERRRKDNFCDLNTSSIPKEGPAEIREGVTKFREIFEPVMQGDKQMYLLKRDQVEHTETLISPKSYNSIWKRDGPVNRSEGYASQKKGCAQITNKSSLSSDAQKMQDMTGKPCPNLRLGRPMPPAGKIPKKSQNQLGTPRALTDNTLRSIPRKTQDKKKGSRTKNEEEMVPNHSRLVRAL